MTEDEIRDFVELAVRQNSASFGHFLSALQDAARVKAGEALQCKPEVFSANACRDIAANWCRACIFVEKAHVEFAKLFPF